MLMVPDWILEGLGQVAQQNVGIFLSWTSKMMLVVAKGPIVKVLSRLDMI